MQTGLAGWQKEVAQIQRIFGEFLEQKTVIKNHRFFYLCRCKI